MPRRARATPGGYVYHVLNRSVAGLPLFRKEADFEAFERIMIEAHGLHPLRILGWCAMRTYGHFVVWPREEGEVTSVVPGIVPRSLEEEENAHEVSWKPFVGTLRVKARPGEPDQHPEASLARSDGKPSRDT